MIVIVLRSAYAVGASPAGSVSISSSSPAWASPTGGSATPAAAAAGGRRRRAAHLPDQERADRAADDAAAHQPERRRGQGQRHAAGEVILVLHQLAERRAGAVAAGHRDRPGNQAEERVHAERLRGGDPDAVLQDREHRGEPPEQQHLRAAHLQQAEARAEPDRREERNHQRRLQRRVEVERDDAAEPQRERDRGEQEPADDRRRNVVAVEHADAAAHAVAGEEDDRRQGERLNEIELEQHRGHVRAGGSPCA
jgi:hypothetical protein